MFGFDFGAAESPLVGAAPVYHPATAALLARMAVPPSAARCDRIDELVGALVSAGVWAKLDVLHVLAAHDAQAALLNWKGDAANLSVGGGAPVFVADRGYFTDGYDDWLDWNWAPSSGVNFQQNSAAIGGWMRKSGNNANSSIGTGTSSAVTLNPRTTSNLLGYRLNSSTATATGASTDGYGLSVIDRSGAAATQDYRNGSALGTGGSGPSATRSSVNINSGRVNSAFSENQFCAHVAGGHLTAAEHQTLHDALSAYMAAVGVALLSVDTATRSLASAITLPDGASGGTAGKGWTCTGLARAPDGSWWIGNDGRQNNGGDPFLSSVVHVSADFSTILGDFTSSALGLPANSIQGVAYDTSDGSLWFVHVNGPTVYHMTTTGTILGSFTRAGANGIAYDSNRDQLIILTDTGVAWVGKTGTTIPGRSFAVGADPDHLFYDATTDTVMYTLGANGTDGKVEHWRVTGGDYGGLQKVRIDTLSGADAIEGLVLVGGNYVVVNDAYFHTGTPALNRALTYSAG